ncbi:phospho-acceptor domain-containing protein [Salsuginibacillus halophilus]|uniref:histidine kinase n=1 Tax=Salsuginibacillus halophilus TaxID=517424 RepID=A0A2P8HFJ2_9BACI|nr:ATP-binding protein [Salsuginibacillus halophilus]PSL45002.1 phospho-acceptor domain-containing protein [Salsuginibacillus halophilus]
MVNLTYKPELQDFSDTFMKLSEGAQLVLGHRGNLVSLNSEAKTLFKDAESWLETLENVRAGQLFLQDLYYDQRMKERTLVHHWCGRTFTLNYKGMYDAGHFVLQEAPAGPSERRTNWDAIMPGCRDFINEAYFPCMIIDHNHRVRHVNQAYKDRFEEFGALNDGGFSCSEASTGEQLTNLIKKAFEEEKFQHDVYEQGWTCIEMSAMYIRREKIVLVMFQDISSQKKYQELLTYKQQMESVSHLAAGVAHELRNPLSVIKGFLQLSQLTGNFDKYAGTIMSEIGRMNEIIENFLSMARQNAEPVILAPSKLFAPIDDILRSECMLQNIEYTSALYEGSRKALMNETMVKQVVLNLLRNACEAFPESQKKKHIHMNTYVKDDFYCIEFIDNGPGIPNETLAQLGEPFVTTKDKGTGIGIPLSKRIVEDHHGEFEIETQENEGTSVYAKFPLLP